MMTRLVLQAPGSLDGSTLGNLLLRLEGSHEGGGVFAWANRAGITAALGSPVFTKFIANGTFDLTVGTDSITDPSALDTLIQLESEHPRLHISAFVHDQPGLFHPKFFWFEEAGGLRLLVGSGNLTRGGLQANWEAFTDSLLTGADADAARQQIRRWKATYRDNLLSIADDKVRAAVEANGADERSIRQRQAPGGAQPSPAASTPNPATGTAVLIAEIPKNRKFTNATSPHFGKSMFSQANFSKEIFENFFGARSGPAEILLYAVRSDASLGDLESRIGKFKSVSMNYYFELGAARGLPHPDIAPPIGAFLRLDSGVFLYLFRLPGDVGYRELDAILAAQWVPRGNQVRRVLIARNQLEAYWPTSPLLAAAEPAT
ncbi:phospholipase D family protein [Cellulomonas sp. B6]|uniref:phospholipase D family protein n=1 Tax=Cellulomonas sp. B6 TaxID=1295626 RepID=UPI0012374387|nr:phospholipase D family protein [Cellulomonas sp. B6]